VRGFIRQSDPVVIVDHQDAGLHPLNDVFGQLCHIGQVHPAACGEGLALLESARELVGENSGTEETCA